MRLAKLTILSLLNPYQRIMLQKLSARHISDACANSIDSGSSDLVNGMQGRLIDSELMARVLLQSKKGFDQRMLQLYHLTLNKKVDFN